MSFQLSVIEKPGYLQAVQRECEMRNCFSVLIEENLSGRRLETWDVYRVVAEGSGRSAGRFEAIAFVDVHAQGELMVFAETVAVNRGLPLNEFSTVAEAEAWLASRER